MRVMFYNQLKTCVAAKDEPVGYKNLLYAAFSERTEFLLEGAYYRVRGLRVALPVDNPPEIAVTLEWLRREPPHDD